MKKKTKKSYFAHSLVLSSLVFSIALVNLINFLIKKPTVNISVSNKEALEFWKKMVTDYPTYKDGYLVLAKLEEEQGNTDESKKLIEKARSLDPNGVIILPETH